MEALIKKLRPLLVKKFPGAKVTLAEAKSTRRIGGQIVWEGFGSVPHIDRQRAVRQLIDSELKPEERSAVSLILTLTPAETAVMAGASDD